MIYIWAVAVVLLIVLECSTAQLVCIWFAGGAFTSLVVSALTDNLYIQLFTFIVSSVIFLILTRPIVKKLKSTKSGPTNADALIGEKCVVLEQVDNIKSQGTVKIRGIVWSVQSADDSVIESGALVRILQIKGVKLIVEKIGKEVD